MDVTITPKGKYDFGTYQSGARRALKVQGALSDGRKVSARLTPKE